MAQIEAASASRAPGQFLFGNAEMADLRYLRQSRNPLILVGVTPQPYIASNFGAWDRFIKEIGRMPQFPEEFRNWMWVDSEVGFFVAHHSAYPKRALIGRQLEAVMLSNGFIKDTDRCGNIEYSPIIPNKVPSRIYYDKHIAKALGV